MAYAKGDKSKTLSAAEKTALVEEVRTNIWDSYQAERDNRQDAASDLAFLAGDQWPEAVRRERELAGRPMLTVNRLPQFVRQVTNDIRQADFSIKVAPEDDDSDPALAKIYDGLIRQIQYQSSASHVYAIAAEHQASCGIGWFRIATEHPDDETFDQEIRIKAIRNPLSVYDDPGAVEPDRSDAMWRAVTEIIPKKAFKAKYPKAADVAVTVPVNSNQISTLFWSTADTIRIAEYWYKTPVKKTLALLGDGQTIDITGKGEGELGYFDIQRTREVDSYKIRCVIVSGAEVLEGPYEWAGSLLPIVPVIGGEMPLEKRSYRFGVIRFARDPQQLYNFYRTATAEAIALAPKAPYLVTPTMVGPYKAIWDTAHKTNRPYLPYNPDPAAPGARPQREAPPMLPTALMQEAQIASDDMKAVTGIYDAALGRQSNETSGIAIGKRQNESDVANYHFADNLQRSLEYAGRVLVDLIPKIYDNERVIRLMGENGAKEDEQFVPINKVVMGVDGLPIMVNDLSAARFDVRVKVGKSYSTKRAEAADSLLQFIQAVPQAGAVAADLIADSMDWPGAEKIAKRLRNQIPPSVLADPDDPNAPKPGPDPIQQQMQAIGMANEQAKVAKTHAETEKLRIDAAIALAQALIPPETIEHEFPVEFSDGTPQAPGQPPPPDPDQMQDQAQGMPPGLPEGMEQGGQPMQPYPGMSGDSVPPPPGFA